MNVEQKLMLWFSFDFLILYKMLFKFSISIFVGYVWIHATYYWKALKKGYNFALNLNSIEGLQKKVMSLQNRGCF